MNNLRIILITLASTILISGTALFAIAYFKPRPGGLSVQAQPVAAVYINGTFSGRTPLDTTSASGDITLKLVPLDSSKSYTPFEAKISLVSGVKTIVRRQFAETDQASSGDIISFEKDAGDAASIVIISTPENAQITLDNVSKGFSPVKTSVSPGKHQLAIKSPGYQDRTLTINTVLGYKLTVAAQLAKLPASPTPSPTPASNLQVFVKILPTPTGYLRVRTQPGTGGTEIDQVKPGDKYLLLGEDADTHWFKIQLEPPAPGLPNGRSGWISDQYAQKVDKTGAPVATPSAEPTTSPIP